VIYGQIRTEILSYLAEVLEGFDVRVEAAAYGASLVVAFPEGDLRSTPVVAGEHLLRGDVSSESVAALSSALAGLDVPHRFERYDDKDTPAGYWHHRWPENEPFPT
jgi:hypothetical protein